MKKTYFVAWTFVVLALSCFAPGSVGGDPKTLRVLFIGNSLTAVNNLPNMVADIAESHGYEIIYDAYAPGGARLFHHASDPNVMKKL